MTGLPENGAAWPPAEHTNRYSRMKVQATWYGGDPAQLTRLYGGPEAAGNSRARSMVQRAFAWFWGRSDETKPDDKMHVPVAQDIANRSAEALFGEGVKFVVQHTLFDAEGLPSEAQNEAVKATQLRLDKLLENMGFDSILLAGAEVAAALGSVAFRIAWDKAATGDMPVITRTDADAVVPEYEWGQLRAVTLWRVVRHLADGTRWLHLERHERGRILHGLYVSNTPGDIGRKVPLLDDPATAYLAPLVDAEGSIRTDTDTMTAISIPNMLPDPLDRLSNAGRSDFSPGVIALFDAIDKAYTSLMRDIDDGKSRLVIADYMLENKGAGQGVEFDEDQHLFMKLKMQPGDDSDAPITQVQFKIRVDEHLKTIEHLTNKALNMAGWNSDSEGASDGTQMTATEYSGRSSRSTATRAKKLRYMQLLERLLFDLLVLDAKHFGSGVTPLPVKMVVPPANSPSMKELAETAQLLRNAKAASTKVIVEHVHPDWDGDQVDREVERIEGEEPVVETPDTFGAPGAQVPGGELAPVKDAAEVVA